MKMNEAMKIIEELKKLDLSKYPEKEIKKLIGGMGKVAAIKTTLHKGKVILRARPNYNGERFTQVSQISYKPAEYNKTYQRASTPTNTMFYGGIISENAKAEELKIGRIIGLLEAVPLIRDTNASGEQPITFSKWVVTKDIELVSIIHHTDFKRENSYAAEQRAYFETVLSSLPKDVADNSRLVSNYMAKEFAKDITPKDYDYIISAIYTELCVSNGHSHGVMYPSVRTGGEGFNVAIHPDIVNSSMIPEYVGECTVYKNKMETMIENETGALILAGQTDFELKPVLPELQIGKENILRKLYPEKYK